MTLIVMLATFLLALVCGGRIRSLERIDIKHVWIFPLGVVLMVLLEYTKHIGLMGQDATILAQPMIYLIIVAGLLLNRQIEGAVFLATGTFLNFLVIAVNGGYMPVSMRALSASGLTMKELADIMYLRHIPMTASTRLAFLGDIIPVRSPHFLRSVGSIGDMMVTIALAYIVWRLFFPSRGRIAQEAAKAAA